MNPPSRPDFPIAELLPGLLQSLVAHPRLVLEAPPGAGKTTQVPLALLGAPWREPIDRPGLAFRIPLVETMESIDKRLQYLDAPPAEVPIESEVMLVDYYAVWRISDPLAFRRAFPGLIPDASTVIQRRLQSEVGATVSKLPLEKLLA